MSTPPTLREQFTNVPNLLTLGRIAVIPLVLVFIDNASPMRCFIASVLYGLAALTDLIDGYLARKWGQISLIGKFLDPLADKLIVMATLVWMVERERVPAWLVVVLLARELSITGLRSIASSEGLVIAASDSGKSKTALQMLGILALILHFDYRLLGTGYTVSFHEVGMYVMYLSLFFSVFSAVEYLRLFARAIGEGRGRSGPGGAAPPA